MSRVKRGVASHKGHKKIIKAAKGYKLGRKNKFKLAKEAVSHAGRNAYRDRRLKKRTFRSLWLTRLSAASKAEGLTYSKFATGLRHAKVIINRKMLSELAIHEKAVFAGIIEIAKMASQ
ncbi:MAG: 50S ribosomal protein L20 [Patescibacteria group bacterium]|nr:50S ribosomal protein L20 [Patescibacteria group bacterium]